MRKFLLLGIVCLLAVSNSWANGTVQYKIFYSTHLGQYRPLGVYLPEGYDPAGITRYPVIYYLHGWGSSHRACWTALQPVLDDMIGSGEIGPCIVVAPNGNVPPYGGSMWTNSALYGAFEDYMAHDVVQYIDTHYLTLAAPQTRSLMGHSMGAMGTMTAGLQHSDIFGALAAHSGFFNWDRIREDVRDAVLSENPGPPYDFKYGAGIHTSSKFMVAGGYSPDLHHPPTYVDFPFDKRGDVVESVVSRWMSRNPDVLAAAVPPGAMPQIFFDCGDHDESFAYPTNLDLAAAFDAMGIEYVFRSFAGNHALTPERLRHSLAFLAEAMSPLVYTGEQGPAAGRVLNLHPIQSNPVVSATAIHFELPAAGLARLSIMDASGRLLETVLDEELSQGDHTVLWRPMNLPSGAYFCELAAGGARSARRLVVMR